ncbi:ABC transporter ATP-binding protein [Halomonas sp. GD1P12]|uniref:ABC transporter ATP-binding protein n=1 Tax=Halomonas sp. GD1P12 TaxID=2982691 RepID=UPI0021E3CBB7|nr:ABC transporter ATP-binding protein [Halomonas sp. GD1P12]UYG00629.1 ABC transporter ATP-binding protein [Halomonas sp. GD1P12]
MIALEDIQFRYPGSEVGVHDINLRVESGEFLVVVGASGSGKSTLLQLIAGFLTPDQGRIMLGGQDMTHTACGARGLGIVLQDYVLFAHMSVLDNVAYPLKVKGVRRDERYRRARATLRDVGLAELEAFYPSQLSGGQQQRVAIARALVFEPRALLLDEPFSALDASRRESMRQELKHLQRQFGVTTLMITHDQEEAMALGDHVALLEAGRLLQHSAPETLYTRPGSEAVARFIGRANFIDAQVVDATHITTEHLGTLEVPPHNFAKGQPVRAMIRPETLLSNPTDDAANRRPVETIERQFLGAQQRLQLRCGNTTLMLEAILPPNLVTQVALPPRHIHLFNR